MKQKYFLLDRKNLYGDMVSGIQKATKLIVIDSYIWIDDQVGNRLGEALLEVADKGVKGFIRRDTMGSVFEHTPGRLPMFYDESYFEKSFWKTIYNPEVGFLTMRNFNRMGFYVYGKKNRPKLNLDNLGTKMIKHPNIIVHNRPFFNHGKVMIIDDQVAYIGGQCISNDYERWVDYNQKIKDPKIVRKILLKLLGKNSFKEEDPVSFINNDFLSLKKGESIYHFLNSFLDKVKDDIYIEMVYLGMFYLKKIRQLISRKINVYLIVPKEADVNQHTNMYLLSKLLKKYGNSPYLHVYLYGGEMVHTKGLATKTECTLGSTNFHSASGYFLAVDEQNFFSKDKKLAKILLQNFQKDLKECQKLPKKKICLRGVNYPLIMNNFWFG